MNSKSEKYCKKTYQSPNLVAYGGIREITRASPQGAFLDNADANPPGPNGNLRSETGNPF